MNPVMCFPKPLPLACHETCRLLHACVLHIQDALGGAPWVDAHCCPSPVQVLRLWEALWSAHLTPHFHLYVAAGVLGLHRRAIMEVRLSPQQQSNLLIGGGLSMHCVCTREVCLA